MKLTYRLALFNNLIPKDPAHYGFDTFQVNFDPFNINNYQEVINYVNGVNLPNVILAFNPSLSNVLFVGKVNTVWYDTIRTKLLALLNSSIGNRIVGVRWNHEYRPSLFYQGTDWSNWLELADFMLWLYVYIQQRSKWDKLMVDLKTTTQPIQFLEKTTKTIYDGSFYDSFRATYKLLVKYVCNKEAEVMNNIYAMALANNLLFLAYPGGFNNTLSPRVFPREEYSFDQNLIYNVANNIIFEMNSWSSFSKLWIDRTSPSIPGNYIATCQLDLRYLSTANAIDNYNWRMNSINKNGIKPIGYGFWSDFNSADLTQINLLQNYMNNLKTVI